MKLNIIVLKHLSAAQKAVQAAHATHQFIVDNTWGLSGDIPQVLHRWLLEPTIILREASMQQLEELVDFNEEQEEFLASIWKEDQSMGFGPLTAVTILIPEPWPKEYVSELLDITSLPLV